MIHEQVVNVSWACPSAAHQKLGKIILEYVLCLRYELQEVPASQRRPLMVDLEKLTLQLFTWPHVSSTELRDPERAAFLNGCQEEVRRFFEREQYFSGNRGVGFLLNIKAFQEHDRDICM